MKQKYYIIKEGYGHRVGDIMEEHPNCMGFFRAFESGSEYVFMSPDEVALDKFNVLNYTALKTNMVLPTDAQEQKGIKDDSSKTQWWYMDNFWPDLEQVADVLTYGDSKYPADDGANWKRLDNPEQRLCDALLRHALKYRYESKDDPETGKSHLAHAITNALMLMYFDRNKKGK